MLFEFFHENLSSFRVIIEILSKIFSNNFFYTVVSHNLNCGRVCQCQVSFEVYPVINVPNIFEDGSKFVLTLCELLFRLLALGDIPAYTYKSYWFATRVFHDSYAHLHRNPTAVLGDNVILSTRDVSLFQHLFHAR